MRKVNICIITLLALLFLILNFYGFLEYLRYRKLKEDRARRKEFGIGADGRGPIGKVVPRPPSTKWAGPVSTTVHPHRQHHKHREHVSTHHKDADVVLEKPTHRPRIEAEWHDLEVERHRERAKELERRREYAKELERHRERVSHHHKWDGFGAGHRDTTTTSQPPHQTRHPHQFRVDPTYPTQPPLRESHPARTMGPWVVERTTQRVTVTTPTTTVTPPTTETTTQRIRITTNRMHPIPYVYTLSPRIAIRPSTTTVAESPEEESDVDVEEDEGDDYVIEEEETTLPPTTTTSARTTLRAQTTTALPTSTTTRQKYPAWSIPEDDEQTTTPKEQTTTSKEQTTTTSERTTTIKYEVTTEGESTTVRTEDAEVTIVTALMDIGRGDWWQYRRPLEKYHEFMENLLSLSNNMVIFTDRSSYDFVHKYRKNQGLMGKTKIHLITMDDLPLSRHLPYAQKIIEDEHKNEEIWKHDPSMKNHPEAKSAEYDIVVNSKTYFLYNATLEDPFGSEDFVWIDAGYGHGNQSVYPYDNKWKPSFPKGKVSMIKLTPEHDPISGYKIDNLYRRNWSVVSGGFIAGDKRTLGQLYTIVHNKFVHLIYQNKVDDDQTVMVLAINSYPHLFSIRQGDWFDAFKMFSTDSERQFGK